MTLTLSDLLTEGTEFPVFLGFFWHGDYCEIACVLPSRLTIDSSGLLNSPRAICFFFFLQQSMRNWKCQDLFGYEIVILKIFRWRKNAPTLNMWLNTLRKVILTCSMWFQAEQSHRVSAGFLTILKLRHCNLLHKSLFPYFRFSQHFASE